MNVYIYVYVYIYTHYNILSMNVHMYVYMSILLYDNISLSTIGIIHYDNWIHAVIINHPG